MKKSIVGKRVKVHTYSFCGEPSAGSPVGAVCTVVAFEERAGFVRTTPVESKINGEFDLFYPDELRYLNNMPVVIHSDPKETNKA